MAGDGRGGDEMPLVEVGTKAPAFTLKDQDGQAHSLKAFAGSALVIFFYPKDDTPGCTKEACGFRDEKAAFRRAGAQVVGVSILDTASKARFAEKHGLDFPLLADPDHVVSEKYGVWQEKRLYGRAFMGIVRTTYLIDGDGKVAARWDNVKIDPHVEEVLAAVRALPR